MIYQYRGFVYKSMKNKNYGLYSCPLFEYKMDYIEDHEIIKSWNMYKSIIYIKNGQHIGPLLGLNVAQYIKPLTNLKNAQGSPKNGLRRSAIAILRRYCRLKTDVKIIIYSRDLAGVSVTLWQRVTFLYL